jgi:hypothetical protein
MTTNNPTSTNSNNSEIGQGMLVPLIFMLFIFLVFLFVAATALNGDVPTPSELGTGWDGFVNLINTLNVKLF